MWFVLVAEADIDRNRLSRWRSGDDASETMEMVCLRRKLALQGSAAAAAESARRGLGVGNRWHGHGAGELMLAGWIGRLCEEFLHHLGRKGWVGKAAACKLSWPVTRL